MVEVAQNGVLRIPRLEDWLDVEEYPGFQIRAWVNFGQPVLNELTSGDQVRIRAALGKIVLEHNGWADFDGEPYPSASEVDAFWDAIPTHLATRAIAAVIGRAGSPPNSLQPTRRSSGSG